MLWVAFVASGCAIGLAAGLTRPLRRWRDVGILVVTMLVLVLFEFLFSCIASQLGLLPVRTLEEVLTFQNSGRTGTPLALAYMLGSFTLGTVVRKLAQAV